MINFEKILEKIVDSKRVLWALLVSSSLFVYSSRWWRSWVWSDSISDTAIIVSCVVFVISIGFIFIDAACVVYGKSRTWFLRYFRHRSNIKLVYGLNKDEMLFMREFVISNSKVIRVKISPEDWMVHNLCKKGIVSLDSVCAEESRYRVGDEIGDIIFGDNGVLFCGVSWNKMSKEQKLNVEKERPDYARFNDWD